MAPSVRRELRRWRLRADAIADPVLRAHALGKLAEAGAHAQVIATLATLAPPRERNRVVVATVAFQVLYDYLDAVSEEPVADPLGNGRQLYRAFDAALTPDASANDCYGRHPQSDDGGYVEALAATCRRSLHALPGSGAVVPVARLTAARCGEAQTRSHAVALEGAAQLERWACRHVEGSGLLWSEVAAGAAASVLAVHALIAAAADPCTTRAEALRIDAAYLPICALTTLLDSLVDRARDAASGSHAYISYYADDAETAHRLRVVARRAVESTATLRHASHHAMSVSGTAAYYLSAAEARRGAARGPARALRRELRPLVLPILLLFRCWRLATSVRERSTAKRSARMPHSSCDVIRRWLSALVPQR